MENDTLVMPSTPELNSADAIDETLLSPEESLNMLGNRLIASVMRNDTVSKQNRQNLFGQLLPRVFKNENFILYSELYNFKDKGISPDKVFLKMHLMRNQKLIKDNAEYVDINAYADLDENPIVGYIAAVEKHYDKLMTLPILSIEEFLLTMEKYKAEYSSLEMSKAYSQSKLILYDGVQYGRKFFQGYDDSVAYVKRKVADVESVLDHTSGAGFIDSSEMAIVEDEDAVKPEKIGDFGLVTELNDILGGYYTSLFYNIMAPTKGGKSKWTTRAIHNIVVEHGNNASVWAHEGGYKAWWAQLRAIHFEWMYIQHGNKDAHIQSLSQKDILYGNYPDENYRQMEQASKTDLFTNPKYGRINMIDRPFVVESFIDEIETSVQLNASKVVLIDYLQLIGSTDYGKPKNQIIGRAYQDLLAYCKKRNVMAISPSQFTQTFMNEMANSKNGDSHELRTDGGEASEIVKTHNINLALYANADDMYRHRMTIMSVPSRLCEPFKNIEIYADLGPCVFSSLGTNNP